MNSLAMLRKNSANFSQDFYYNKSIFESKSFRVIPSLGSLIKGWLLIIPKECHLSFSSIKNPLNYDELYDLIQKLGGVLKKEYGDFVVFEHGPIVKESLVGCSVDYAHLHVVPIRIDLIKESKQFLKKQITWSSISGIQDTSQYYETQTPYLFVTDNFNNSFIGLSEELPSQLFRRTIAKHTGIEMMYDWKEHSFLNNMQSTIQTLRKYKKVFSEL